MTKLTIAERAVVVAFFALAFTAVVLLGSVVGYLVAGPQATLYCPGDDCPGFVMIRFLLGTISAAIATFMALDSATLKKLTGGAK